MGQISAAGMAFVRSKDYQFGSTFLVLVNACRISGELPVLVYYASQVRPNNILEEYLFSPKPG